MVDIKHVGVVGAGIMGSGIAAHAANAGLQVTLLDISADLANAGVQKQVKNGGFMSPDFANRVRTGSIDEHLDWLADADWIVEAVAERLDIKHGLYTKIASVKKPEAILSSNTSTIPLDDLIAGMPDVVQSRFAITHFFNPPRHMRLFELVTGRDTDPAVASTLREFADIRLGKGVVTCKDTPGFIGNRIGNYWLFAALSAAFDSGLDVEEIDALMSAPFGVPKSGIFGLFDLVGIDLMRSIAKSFATSLPAQDAMQLAAIEPQVVTEMIATGRLGRKSGAGFYKVSADRKQREVVDLATGAYRAQVTPASDAMIAAKSGPAALMAHDSAGGRYASLVMRNTLKYAAALVPEIADTPFDVDQAMTLGYGWKQGPFSLLDTLGCDWFVAHLESHGESVPEYLRVAAKAGGFYRREMGKLMCLLPNGGWQVIEPAPGIVALPAVKAQKTAVVSDAHASLWDMGDGVGLIELHAKMNALSPALVSSIAQGLRKAGETFSAAVIGTGGANFSAGADLASFLAFVEAGEINAIVDQIDRGQELMRAIRFAPIPIVSAAAGFALGGGCEILLHSAGVEAHAELQAGLVETSVGVIPAWGGCKQMLAHFSSAEEPLAAARSAFDLIIAGTRSKSAENARRLGILSHEDGIVMNIDRVLGDAKRRALGMAKGYQPPQAQELRLVGPSGASALRDSLGALADLGQITAHDRLVGETLIDVLTGGPSADPNVPVHEDAILVLERDGFVELLKTTPTRDRVRHMLATGKPLRN